ncbi:hypothetical protein F53441_8226 [Fusarium austroafricanum]|uniref:BZIP domain-containing protein n=1 Tax=Fusarium austroafricanum TaxID=2364996 RepID=A0A8H4NXJ9_9HYPO|nr:hypothetical protein F53441_8226 [Fusarium austroafricanum]
MPVNQVDRAQERKDRKRTQNRLNQRARRERMRIEAEKSIQPGKRPYRVDRWRLGTADTANAAQEPAKLSTDTCTSEECSIISNEDGKSSSSEVEEVEAVFPQALTRTRKLGCSISPDHSLIHLICHNVCRGFMANKHMMYLMESFVTTSSFPTLCSDSKLLCKVSLVRPVDQRGALPARLEPTQLQMQSPHPTWMDILPFPDLRDSLIRNQRNFDHLQFMEGLVGDFVYIVQPNVPKQASEEQGNYRPKQDTGLILWGEPHLSESWEVSPSFLARWSWVIGECTDLVRSSNNWRQRRGEDLMPLAIS